MNQLPENSIKKIQEEYSISSLIEIYEEQIHILYYVFAFLSIITSVLLFFSKQFYFAIIPIIIVIYCVYKISKIKHYQKGVLDGINSGFEYGEIHADLELLLSDDTQNHFYSRLLYNLYTKHEWNPEPKQTDHFKLEKFLSNKFLDTL